MAGLLNLRSSLRKKLLSYLFINESAEHYVRDLARILEVDPTNLSRELARLGEQGLLSSEMRGSHKYYRLDRSYPLYRETRRLIQNTIGLVPQLRKKLTGIPSIETAWLYGSFAKGNEDRSSDVDLLIVGHPKTGDLEKSMRQLERTIGRQINYTLISRNEWEQRLSEGDAFLTDVVRGKKIDLLA